MIIKKLMAFLVVSLLLILAYAYAFWIKDNGDTSCSSIWECLKTMHARLFDFSPSEITLIETTFGILIMIVLLNVVIAIVGEAWTSAAEKSTEMFWMFRLEKIYQLRCAATVRDIVYNPNSTHTDIFSVLMKKIDRVESISYGDNVSWTKPPYHVLKRKDHYNNPRKYFCEDLSVKVIDAHSLQADMYWHQVELLKRKEKIYPKDQEKTHEKKKKTSSRAQIENGEEEEKTVRIGSIIVILAKWLGHCLCYTILVVMGIPLCGIIWPKKFRAGLLSMGNSYIVSAKSDESVITNLMHQLEEKSAKIKQMQQLAETNAELMDMPIK